MPMRQFPLEQRHGKQARELYPLRARLLARRMTGSRSLLELERRLSVHLDILSRMNVEAGSPNSDDTQRFLHFATALQTENEQALRETCRQALEQLCDDKLADAPLHDAFALYPPAFELLQTLYQELPGARAAIFSLWRRQHVELPAGLLNQAELQRENPRLQHEALAYAANHPAYGLDLFRAYYTQLLQSAAPSLDEILLVPVLWGGLVRGDPDAPPALQRAVERAESNEVRAGLLRLMALNGAPEYLSILLEAARQSNVVDTRTLALSGRAEAAELLLERLGQPQHAKAVHDDWVFLTGHPLPERPMLMLVDSQDETADSPSEAEQESGLVPDSQAARLWWEHHRAAWGEQRLVMGQPGDTTRLITLCRHFAGETAADLTDLLALRLKRPLGLSPRWGWQSLRLDYLKSQAKPADNPTSTGKEG
jgi:hypothetical protein